MAVSRTPDRVGPYEILGVLGKGGMGRVLKGRHPRTDRVVAIKQLLAGFDDEQRARFAREAAVLGELSHPGVVRLLDHDVEVENPYIVFELIEGRSLAYAIGESAPFPLAKSLDFSIQIADALAALHERGLVHRDLKPANVMLRPGDQLVLIDLGISKHVGDFKKTMDQLTRAGVLLGTPGYFPPEGGMEPDSPAGDCFALGVTLYAMLTRTRPFIEAEKQGMIAYLDCIREGGYPPASSIVSKIPKAVDEVVARLLRVDPQERVRDGAQAVQVLQELATSVLEEPERRAAEGRWAARTQQIVVRSPSSSGRQRAITTTGGGKRSGPVVQPTTQAASGSLGRRFLALRLGALFIAVAGALGIAAMTREESKPVPDPSPNLSPFAPPPASIADADHSASGFARKLREVLHSANLAKWVNRVLGRHELRVRTEPASLTEVLRQELDGLKVLRPAAQFLQQAASYFADRSLSEAERWATRTAMIDLEILEYFCDEHRIPWLFKQRISECAAVLDVPARPWKINLLAARTWGKQRESKQRGFFLDAPLEESWGIPEPAPNEQVMVWFPMLKWRSSLLLDVVVNSRFRKILRYRPNDNHTSALPAYREHWTVDGQTKLNWRFSPDSGEPKTYAYLAFWVPRPFWARPLQVRTRIIDIPLTKIALSDSPTIIQRAVTLVPTSALVSHATTRRSP